jgi:hypothetical protein
MMRTRLARFSADFDAVVRPLLAPLQRATSALAETSSEIEDTDLLPDLTELHHQLETLVNKVEEQQAYVLIFGPLKSGKSTLMNALSAAYVSEVTSLPAYPCMVYVSYAPQKTFKLTRYDGKVDELSDAGALRLHVQRAHSELAARIREVESEGATFDPSTHLPSAIRRIDVGVPAGELEQSGAVLVDTPGLYSRMRFGYDRMTKDFRNAAACAMFVVKTDNLFLEQVFDEFNELLELFSRIFLIVNIDTTKADLGPDGELVPSLEQTDPLRLIEAFENLAMSAPLKQAAEDGRLRIYPVDLLRAGSWRLQQAIDTAVARATGQEDVEENNDKRPDQLEDYKGQASFDAFLGDLTEFLNSTDYLNAFLNDSLRRARTLLSDVAQLCDRPSVIAFLGRLSELECEREEGRVRRDALERLETFPWNDASAGIHDQLTAEFIQRGKGAEERTTKALDAAVTGWFQTDASLQALLEDELLPILTLHRNELLAYAREALAREALDETGGLNVPDSVKADLLLNEVSLERLARQAVRSIGPMQGEEGIEAPFGTRDLPVRKKVWDWVFFRRKSGVRSRLFGPKDQPSHRIPVADKEAILGDVARRVMENKLDLYLPAFFRDAAMKMPERVLEAYEKSFRTPLAEELAVRRSTIDKGLEQLERRVDELLVVKEHITGLDRVASSGLIDVVAMTARHGMSVVEDELLPTPPPKDRHPLAPSTPTAPSVTPLVAPQVSERGRDALQPLRDAVQPLADPVD